MKYLKEEKLKSIITNVNESLIKENLYFILEENINSYKKELVEISRSNLDLDDLISRMNKSLNLFRMISFKEFDVDYVDTKKEPIGVAELKSLVAIAKMFKEVNG